MQCHAAFLRNQHVFRPLAGFKRRTIMARGSKDSYTAKQKRKAKHIEDAYEERGISHKEAEERAWRTVNKQDGGGKKK